MRNSTIAEANPDDCGGVNDGSYSAGLISACSMTMTLDVNGHYKIQIGLFVNLTNYGIHQQWVGGGK